MAIVTYSIRIVGRVQGVGFRPFLYRLAHSHALAGWAQNLGGGVECLVQGDCVHADAFLKAVVEEAPPLAKPRLARVESIPREELNSFAIRESAGGADTAHHLPPDYFACDDCLAELRNPADRRYRYPFINCTQCGPRYTLIQALPYDRPNTAMHSFALCPACRQEYENPLDRRFHAEPIACPQCGPALTYMDAHGEIEGNEAALGAALANLKAGSIVAVKGIGGYHLLCDAQNTAAVARLRQRKQRPDKPLAVMFPWQGDSGLDAVLAATSPGEIERAVLLSPERPIVLCRKRADAALPPAIAPGLDEIGVMLPYSPLHHLLLDDFGAPLVATSGNISGEPVLTVPQEAGERLRHIADAFLHHNRPILRPADDSVYRVIAGKARPLRLGRGTAPVELELSRAAEVPTLAVGAHMKNSVALAWGGRVVFSPHIGELSAPRSMQVFGQVIDDLQQLYGVQAGQVCHDAHPGYAGTRWARECGLPRRGIYHHIAHASALYGEQGGEGDWLVFTWDGVGLGMDGTLWGGEALYGRPGQWQRVASLRPFRLSGGEKAGREPWRSALGVCWEAGVDWPDAPNGQELLFQAWQRQLNCPVTSAAGRLFDAAAALLGLCHETSFEGQGPMLLEAIAAADAPAVPLPLTADEEGLLRIDWQPLLPVLLDETTSREMRAGIFHASLALALFDTAEAIGKTMLFTHIGLSGGVFQNRLLTELIVELARQRKLSLKLHEKIPCNDGGIAYGQIIEALSRQ